ncbi:unnamed protein product [Mytilus coruscus]|uniref:B box-type domain-containing protein n=1 Tax=Mytilus coruscus TaxID=42192 RepID=A0A6J8AW11_MYTCO|nr:unnamed protein product [Mytilus coruscus]
MHRLDIQVSIFCTVCGTRKNLKYRCMECNIITCEKCKDIHSISPSNSSHTILSFDSIITNNCTEYEIRKMHCKKHNTKKYSSFCQTCKFLICEYCFTESHSYHRSIDIDKFVHEKYTSEDKSRKKILKTMSSDDSDFIFVDCPEDDSSHTVEFEVIKTFTTHLPAINCIEMVNKDEACICHYKGDICKIKLTPILFTNRLKYFNEVKGLEPADLAVNSVGDIYFICKSDNFIKLVKKNKHDKVQVSSVSEHFTMEPLCIHIEKDNDSIIWIGLAEIGANFELAYNSSRQVVSISPDGKVCSIFEYTEENQPLFTFPWRITTNQDRIYVIDRKSQYTGTIVALNKYGYIKWRYSDLHPYFSPRPFLPSDVVVTEFAKIIVLDSANNALHILSYDGIQILRQSLEDLKIEYPISMKFDELHYLWIGNRCKGAIDNKRRAKLYKIQIKGI